jgi:hypothetical protein
MNMSRQAHEAYKRSGKEQPNPPEPLSPSLLASLRTKFPLNYFGLPPWRCPPTSESLAYKSRTPLDTKYTDTGEYTGHSHKEGAVEKVEEQAKRSTLEDEEQDSSGTNTSAQRKVARALLTMVSNDVMITHFIHRGGLDAVLRLLMDSRDLDVLQVCADCLLESSRDPNTPIKPTYCILKYLFNPISLYDTHLLNPQVCADCLLESSMDPAHCRILLERGVFSSLQGLIEVCIYSAYIVYI